MAPKEENCGATAPQHSTNDSAGVSYEFINRLQKYAWVSGATDFYKGHIAGHINRASEFYQDQVKKHDWLSRTVTSVTSTAESLSHVMKTDKLYPIVWQSLTTLDQKACHYMDTLQAKQVGEMRKQVVNQTTEKVKMAAFRTGRRVMRSCVGQVALWCLDGSINMSESALYRLCNAFKVRPSPDLIAEADSSPAPPPPSNGHAAAGPAGQGNRALVQWMDCAKSRSSRTLRKVTIGPMKALVKLLRRLRKILHKLRGSHTDPRQQITSPEKQTAIESRRKVSPRKRVEKQSGPKRMAISVIGWLTGKHSKPSLSTKNADDPDVDEKLETSPNQKKDKRKHEAVSEDEMSFNDDLTDYDSADDPDYVPNFNVSSDSMEWATGDTDNEDLDTENPDPDHECCELHHIKEKPDGATVLSSENHQNGYEAQKVQ